MYHGIAHNPALSNLVTTGLKLRFDERDKRRAVFGKCDRAREHFGKTNEAGIAYDQVNGLRNMDGRKYSGAGLFMDDHTAVLTQFPRQLVGAAVHGIYARGVVR